MKKRAVAICLAIAVLMSVNVWGVAAAENRCTLFENAVKDVWYFQTADVAADDTFAPTAISAYVFAHIQAYDVIDDVLRAKAEDFEAIATAHFDVTAEQLQGMQIEDTPLYDPETETYLLTERNGGSNETYAIRGYTEETQGYCAYFSLVETNYDKPANAVEGVDYIVDAKGNAMKLTGKHLEVLFAKGDTVKFLTWKSIAAIPETDDFVTPSVPTKATTTTVTTAQQTKTTTATQAADTPATTTAPTNRTGITTIGTQTSIATTALRRTTVPTEPLVLMLQTEGATVNAAANAFPADTVLTCEAASIDVARDAKEAMGANAVKLTVYTVTATAGQKAVHPAGRATLTLDIPADYTATDTAIAYINERGVAEILVSRIDAATRTVTADITQMGTFAVVQLPAAAQTNGFGRVWIPAVIIAVLLVGWCVYRRKANKATTDDAQPTDVVLSEDNAQPADEVSVQDNEQPADVGSDKES